MLMIGLGASPMYSQEASGTDKIKLTPILKLGSFAAACSSAQVRNLLERDPDFDINSYPATLTPVQLAMKRLLQAIISNDIGYQNACLATIRQIMTDQRYSWKETGPRQNTDLTYFLRNTKGVSDNNSMNGYRTAILVILDLLRKRPDFDINYRLQAPHGPTHVATAAGAAAAGGLANIWCDTLAKIPEVDLEERKDETSDTPLLMAVRSRNLEMTKLLIGLGADYLVHVEGIPGNAAQTIAQNVGALDIRDFLIDHQKGRQLGSVCPQAGAE